MKFSLNPIFYIFCLTIMMQSYSGIGDAFHEAVSGAANIAGEAIDTTGDIVHDVLDPRDTYQGRMYVDDALVDDYLQEKDLEEQRRPVKRVTEVTRTTEYLD